MPKKVKRDNPVELLVKYQHNEPLTPRENDTLWTFFYDYVGRCEYNHFKGNNTGTGEAYQATTDKVVELIDYLKKARDVVYVHTPYYLPDGRLKYAKSCSLTSPHKHPNSILTAFRMSFAVLETLLRLRRLGVRFGSGFGYFDTLAHRTELLLYTDVAKRYRASGYSLTQDQLYEAWYAEHPNVTTLWKTRYVKCTCRYLYFHSLGNANSLSADNGYDMLQSHQATSVFL